MGRKAQRGQTSGRDVLEVVRGVYGGHRAVGRPSGERDLPARRRVNPLLSCFRGSWEIQPRFRDVRSKFSEKSNEIVTQKVTKLRPWENWTEGPQDTTCVWIQRRSSTVLPGGDPRRPIAVPLLRARSMRPRPRGRRSAPRPPLLGTTGEHRAVAGDDTGQGPG